MEVKEPRWSRRTWTGWWVMRSVPSCDAPNRRPHAHPRRGGTSCLLKTQQSRLSSLGGAGVLLFLAWEDNLLGTWYVRPRVLGMYSLLLGPHTVTFGNNVRAAPLLGERAERLRFGNVRRPTFGNVRNVWERARPYRAFGNVCAAPPARFGRMCILATAFWDHTVTFGNVRNVWERFGRPHSLGTCAAPLSGERAERLPLFYLFILPL